MAASQQIVAIERNRQGIVLSLVEAWACLNLLRGINSAAGGGLSEARARCAAEMYRAAFAALYVAVGTILDTSDGVHSLEKLGQRLHSHWASDPELVALVDQVKADVASDHTAAKLKAWRNKAIAHRTGQAADPEFYRRNQVNLDEVAASLEVLTDQLNVLSVNFDGVVNYGLEATVPGLAEDVAKLFAGGT